MSTHPRADSACSLLDDDIQQKPNRCVDFGDSVMGKLNKTKNRRPHLLIVGLGVSNLSDGESTTDLAYSPGRAIAVHLLSAYNVYVEYADPMVDEDAIVFIPRFELSNWTAEALQAFDAVVIAARQPGLDGAILETLEGTHVEWYRPVECETGST